ncbi:MAG: cytidylate kinase family protein, partial [Thermodesulfobacteriota bacterium]
IVHPEARGAKQSGGGAMAILTISRQYGSGGQELGRTVAERLGYDYVDKESLFAAIRQAGGRWREWAEGLDEQCPTTWERFDWSFRGFAALVRSQILAEATRDRVVIMGRGANFLLAGVPHALRVRVEAPLTVRQERLAAREGVDAETARWLCKKVDHGRACFLAAVYGRTGDDAADYDTVLAATGLDLTPLAEQVKAELAARDRLWSEEAARDLEMRALAARVQAGLATDPHLFVPILEVAWTGEELVLSGVVHSVKEHQRVEEAARRLAGEVPLSCALHYRR